MSDVPRKAVALVGAILAAALISARISLSPLKIEIEEDAIANFFLL